MRISDWSSDVCSSDLAAAGGLSGPDAVGRAGDGLSGGGVGGAARPGWLSGRRGRRRARRRGGPVKRLVPYPLLALSLFAMWILLTGFSPGHVLLGALVALIVSRSMLSLKVEPPRVRVGWEMVRLAAILDRKRTRMNSRH